MITKPRYGNINFSKRLHQMQSLIIPTRRIHLTIRQPPSRMPYRRVTTKRQFIHQIRISSPIISDPCPNGCCWVMIQCVVIHSIHHSRTRREWDAWLYKSYTHKAQRSFFTQPSSNRACDLIFTWFNFKRTGFGWSNFITFKVCLKKQRPQTQQMASVVKKCNQNCK